MEQSAFREPNPLIDQSSQQSPTAKPGNIPSGVAYEVLCGALYRRNETSSTAESARVGAEADPEQSKWSSVADEAHEVAERSAVEAILALDPDFSTKAARGYPAQDRWTPRAVRLDGRIYLACPDPSRDRDDHGGNGQDLMKLAVVEAADFLDLDAEEPPSKLVLTPDQDHAIYLLETLGRAEFFGRAYLKGGRS